MDFAGLGEMMRKFGAHILCTLPWQPSELIEDGPRGTNATLKHLAVFSGIQFRMT